MKAHNQKFISRAGLELRNALPNQTQSDYGVLITAGALARTHAIWLEPILDAMGPSRDQADPRRSPHVELLCDLALHPHATHALLQRLAHESNWHVREYVAARPTLDEEMRYALAGDHLLQVAHSAAWAMPPPMGTLARQAHASGVRASMPQVLRGTMSIPEAASRDGGETYEHDE